jgi:hypothetical protein
LVTILHDNYPEIRWKGVAEIWLGMSLTNVDTWNRLNQAQPALKLFLFPGNILALTLRESDGTYQMTSPGDKQWLALAPGQLSVSHPVESISFFKFEIPWDSSLHNSKHLDR